MLPPRILIAGCGYLGVRLAEVFIERGSQVYGLRRSKGGPQAERMPVALTRIHADLTRLETLKPLPDVDAVFFCQAPGKHDAHDAYEKTYLEGTRNLLEALHAQSMKPAVLFISSTSVYSTRDGAWIDAATNPRLPGHPPDEAGKRAEILLAAEEWVLNSGFDAKIVRSSGIYGPNRNRLKPILEGAFAPELSQDFTNRVRVEDLVSAVCAVAESGKPGERYIASDDQPTTQREFYEWLYGQLKMPLPASGTDLIKRHTATDASAGRGSNKRCRNDKLKSLGWTPQYPTYKEGYADLLAAIA